MAGQEDDLHLDVVAQTATHACERCYLRKRKCDKRLPSCSNCLDAGSRCTFSTKISKRSLISDQVETRVRMQDLEDRVNWLEGFIRTQHASLAHISRIPTNSTMTASPRHATGTLEVTNTDMLLNGHVQTEDLDLTILVGTSPLPLSNNGATFPQLSNLVSSGLVMGNYLPDSRRAPCQWASASQHPTLPSHQSALCHIRQYLAEFKQSHHCVALDELEEDLRLVYGEDGLVAAHLTASRFRAFMVLYLRYRQRRGTEVLSQEDSIYAQSCKDFGMAELGKVLSQENLLAVQALVLLALIGSHEPTGPSMWQLLGLAARTVISINLHRRNDVYLAPFMSYSTPSNLESLNVKRKNIFWALYCLDRLAVFILSQPFAIDEALIDVELPAISQDIGSYPMVSDVALRCHNIQLRSIQGRIYSSLYALTVPTDRDRVDAESTVADLTSQVHAWYSQSPLKLPFAPISDASISIQITNDLSFHQLIIALHRPSRLIAEISSPFVQTLKGSAERSIDMYRHYWRNNQVLITQNHIYQLFTSCISLLYCYCECNARPDLCKTPIGEINARITQCKELLVRFGPTWPDTYRYQAMFDSLIVPLATSILANQPNDASESDIISGAQAKLSSTDGVGSVEDMSWLLGESDSEGQESSPHTVMRRFWEDLSCLGEQ